MSTRYKIYHGCAGWGHQSGNLVAASIGVGVADMRQVLMLLGLAAIDGLHISRTPSWAGVAHSRVGRLRAAELPISESSSLAELRAFVKEQGLEVKTSGPGRSKAVIYSDVMALVGETVDASPADEPAAEVATDKAATEASAAAEAAEAAEVAKAAEAAEAAAAAAAEAAVAAATKASEEAAAKAKAKAKASEEAAVKAAEEAAATAAAKASEEAAKAKAKAKASEEAAAAAATAAAAAAEEQAMGEAPDGFEWGGTF